MKNLLIYGTIFDLTDDMSLEESGQLFIALNKFRKGEEVIFEDRYLKGVWAGILPTLEIVKGNYNKKVTSSKLDSSENFFNQFCEPNVKLNLTHSEKWNKVTNLANYNDEIKSYLKKLDYSTFLHTEYWKTVSKQRKLMDLGVCTVCDSDTNLHTHHKTYVNKGNDHNHMNTLTTLCGSCHRNEHIELAKLENKGWENKELLTNELAKLENKELLTNELDLLQKEFNGFNFIKSYPMLSKLQITLVEKSFIELILSYNNNGKSFYLNYSVISDILVVKVQSVKNMVSNLKKNGYIFTENTKNFKVNKGGSSTKIEVNVGKIIDNLRDNKNK